MLSSLRHKNEAQSYATNLAMTEKIHVTPTSLEIKQYRILTKR